MTTRGARTGVYKDPRECGLTMSLEKTKLIVMGKDLRHENSLLVQLATVEEFTYLGSNIT